jgi:hypothetical protein
MAEEVRSNTSGTKPFSFWERMRELSMFFEGTDSVHRTMRRVVEKLREARIPYAIVGGMALNAHNYRRATNDVDFLLTTEGLAAFQRLYLSGTFQRVPGRSHRFLDAESGVTFDILETGRFPGSGDPGPIAYPDPAAVSELIENASVVNLKTLIELKLAARRYKDFGDVVELIRIHNLDESFSAQLHPSLHGYFIECLEEMRRELEYERRQNSPLDGTTDTGQSPSGS